MRYQVFVERAAQKSLGKIPHDDRTAVEQKIRDLADDPRPAGVKKLSGREAWRIRIGNYRVIYEINDGKLIVLVVVIGHRKDVYR